MVDMTVVRMQVMGWNGIDPVHHGDLIVLPRLLAHLPYRGLGDALPDILHPARQSPVPAVSPAHQQPPATLIADKRASSRRYRVRRRSARVMPVVTAAHGAAGLTVAHTSSNCAAYLSNMPNGLSRRK